MSDKWHGGKGSKTRPTNKQKFDDNWDRIFGKKDKECKKSTTSLESTTTKR
jgi:hypothetical protein